MLRGAGRSVVVAGDFNTARGEMDVHKAFRYVRNPGFLPVERDWLNGVLFHAGPIEVEVVQPRLPPPLPDTDGISGVEAAGAGEDGAGLPEDDEAGDDASQQPAEITLTTATHGMGFVDCFRKCHPDTPRTYSWFDVRRNARVHNAGWRLDYVAVSDDLAEACTEAGVLYEADGSDHLPVTATLAVDISLPLHPEPDLSSAFMASKAFAARRPVVKAITPTQKKRAAKKASERAAAGIDPSEASNSDDTVALAESGSATETEVDSGSESSRSDGGSGGGRVSRSTSKQKSKRGKKRAASSEDDSSAKRQKTA